MPGESAVPTSGIHKKRAARTPETPRPRRIRRHTLLQPLPLLKMEGCFGVSDWVRTSRNDRQKAWWRILETKGFYVACRGACQLKQQGGSKSARKLSRIVARRSN